MPRKNSQIIRGLERFSRSQAARAHHVWKHKKTSEWKTISKAKKEVAPKIKPFGKGEQRSIKSKAPRYYPEEDVHHPLRNHKTPKPTRLRKKITPGTVLILLAGRFRGKRVIFLKQLESGLLLVTGPYKLNGVPLRRVNQAYVIATSTKVDISSVTLDPKRFNDNFFKRARKDKKKTSSKSEEEFFAPEKKEKTLDSTKVEDQKTVDAQLLPLIKKTKYLKQYLKTAFTLSRGQYPHLLRF